MQLVQNNNFVFATLFIYGSNGAPTWFTGQLTNVGGFTWSGPLFATTGPYFAATPYNAGSVTVQSVGTMSFASTDISHGVLTYTVNGVTVQKNVTRQTLVYENLTGTYDVVGNQSQICQAPTPSGDFTSVVTMSFNHVGTNVTGQILSAGGTCALNGTYSQTGKLGKVIGTFACSWGESGTFSFFEITITEGGLLARIQEQSSLCSSIVGTFAGNFR